MMRTTASFIVLAISLAATLACAVQIEAKDSGAPQQTRSGGKSNIDQTSDPIIQPNGPRPIQEIFEPVGDFPPTKFFKVAALQWAPPPSPIVDSVEEAEKVKAANRAELEIWIRRAAANGAKLVVTPELGVVGYPDIPELPDEDDAWRDEKDIDPYTESIPGPTTYYFSRVASELRIYLQIGGVEKLNGKYYNFAVMFGPDGRIIGKHHKNNLYGLEVNYITPGTEPTIVDTPAGKMALLVCADIYHTPLLQKYRGYVSAMAMSVSWAQPNTGWDYYTRGTIFVGAYMVASNHNYYPDTGIINPDGSIQARIRQTLEGITYGYLPLRNPKGF